MNIFDRVLTTDSDEFDCARQSDSVCYTKKPRVVRGLNLCAY